MMVIGKINTVFMKHSRILFGMISVVVIVSFLGFLTPGFTSLFSGGGAGGYYGSAFGRKVPYSEVRDQAERNRIAYTFAYGGMIAGRQLEEMAAQNAFGEICRQAAAAERGIYVGDAEVTDYIAVQPRFREQGKFKVAKYEEFLRASGVKESVLYEALRNFLVSRKLNQELIDSVTVTPGELAVCRERFTGRNKLRAADYVAADYLGQAKVGDAEVKKYFESSRDKYMIPGSFRAVLAELPFDAPAVKQAAAKGKIPAREAALHLGRLFARDAYETVGESMVKDRRKAFEKAARARGFQLSETPRISADAKKAGKIDSAELVAQLAQVYANVPVSNAVAAGNAVYVGFVIDPVAPRRAEFKEVAAKVTAELRGIAAAKLASAAAHQKAAELKKAPAAKRAAMVKGQKIPAFRTLEPFSLLSLQAGHPAAEIASSLDSLKPGDVKVIPGRSGATLYWFEAVLPAGKDAPDDQVLLSLCRRYKGSAVAAAFDSYLNSRCAQYARDRE